jgi:hypothetical protein
LWRENWELRVGDAGDVRGAGAKRGWEEDENDEEEHVRKRSRSTEVEGVYRSYSIS